MSARSRAAWRLSLDLARRFGLRPGAIELRWDNTYFPGGYRWGWVVDWADGPIVDQLRAAVGELVGEALAGEVQRGLAYHRGITPLAWAIQLVAAAQAGMPLGDVEGLWWREDWEARLAATPFPERAATPDQERLARLLVEVAGSHDERQLGRVLAEHGLGGLATLVERDPAVVVPLARARRRRPAPPGRWP
jgi:hypothetical protein